MKCPVCDGKGYFQISDIAAKVCPQCNGTGEIEQTNEEWFCGLSTEEKAEVILKKTTELRLERKWSKRYIEEWLKEKHE